MSTAASEPVVETRKDDLLIRAIFEHAARIDREQDIEELVRLNADFSRELAQAERCSLWLVDEETEQLWTLVAHGIEPIRIPLGAGLVGACVSEDRVFLVNDAEHEPRLLRTIDESSGYRTRQVLCVPMRADGQVIGALQLLNKPSGFNEIDAGLLGLLAHFAASAISSERLRQEAERARLTMYELALAHDVQERLLPVCPRAEGLECVGFCRPARTIGGDYYDLLALNDGKFALTLGDVSGKGIPAAVMMASIQTLLRSLLQSSGKSLADIGADLNQALYQSSTAERYSTLFFGMISADRRTLNYGNAGQVEPFLLHQDGGVERLPGGGLPVGMIAGSTYEEGLVALRPGDTLVVVSDGIVESSNEAGDFWEEESVERALVELAAGELAELPTRLCAEADRFAAGAKQYDDMTIVGLRIH
jgi:sigma-B regulation protein RsbU (phosphoserine phosphatase)